MKLLKKLLPVATIASTAAIVAPIVTSCGASKTFACTINAEGEQDKYYEATIEPKAKDSSITDVAKGQEVYFADIEKNKMILVDDILFSQFGQTQKMMGLNEEGETTEISVSLSISSFNAKDGTLSGKAKIKQTQTEIEQNSVTFKMDLDFTFEYNNIPMQLTYSKGGWRLAPHSTKITESDWTIKGYGIMKEIQEQESGTIITGMELKEVYNKDYPESSVETDIKPLEYLKFKHNPSHYFLNQTITE